MSANTPLTSLNKRSIVGERLEAELLGAGVVRLYRDSDGHLNESMIENKKLKSIPGNNTTVAILAVPFYFTASDLLLGFFDSDDSSKISHLRMVKSVSPNRYMLLVKLRSSEYVKPFLRKYQGRNFNSFEPEKCSVIEIKEIIFRSEAGNDISRLSNSLPYLLEDPFTNEKYEKNDRSYNYTELATCPVCLDRLDSTISGLFTIPCQHTYHSSCLSKWKDDTCPVCRYSNKEKSKLSDDTSSREMSSTTSDEVENCVICHSTSNLWICLICGNVGCGRYHQKHAIGHWEQTGHCFAMEANSQRVWDYSADGYVHRLVQNEADGKIIELPLKDESNRSNDEKIDKIGFEYSKLLIDQLESQRRHYESRMEDLFLELSTKDKYIEKLKGIEKQFHLLESENIKEKSKIEERMNSVERNLVTLSEKNTKLTELNKTLISTIKDLKQQNDILGKQNKNLHEQVGDLMFYLDSQDKFKDASDDVREGTIVTYPNRNG
ncbi:hypothetical protein CANINC_004425 [Pichia inconspicua]|uniref:RING-type domain-containing protein n=1 Tax=Pichia inconspicua TaxID=52247 RepID=A0A4T0WWP7_9ASCO|nr:hypothetical protein CANINC_004425 [[Candida] inconspicua]